MALGNTDIFNLSTSEGIGAGEAQVFQPYDVSKFENRRIAAEQKKQAAEQQRIGQIERRLTALDKPDIFFRDAPLFAKGADEIYNYAHENWDKLKSGDSTATLGFNRLISEWQVKAAQSKNVREGYEQGNTDVKTLQLLGKTADPDSIEYLKGFADPSQMGNFNFDRSQINADIDLDEIYRKNIEPIYDKAYKESKDKVDNMSDDDVAKATTTFGVPKEQFDAKIRGQVTNNPRILKKINRELQTQSEDIQKQYSDDPTQYWIDKLSKSYFKRPTTLEQLHSLKGVGISFGGRAEKDIELAAGKKTETYIGGGEAQGYDSMQPTTKESYEEIYANTIKPTKMTIALPAGSIDKKTNRKLEKSDVGREMSIGKLAIIPFHKTSGIVVGKETLKKIKKEGNESELIEYRPVAYIGDAEKIGSQNFDESYIIPLSDAEGVLKDTWGYNVSKYYDVAKNLNSKLSKKQGGGSANTGVIIKEKYPLPKGKAARGKKGDKWYVWDTNTGQYIAE